MRLLLQVLSALSDAFPALDDAYNKAWVVSFGDLIVKDGSVTLILLDMQIHYH